MFDREKVLEEFDREMAGTRRVLEGVPADRLDWKPHEKSRTLGELALHVANLPRWLVPAVKKKGANLADFPEIPEDGPAVPGPREILQHFDDHVEEARNALRKADADAMGDPWTLRVGEDVLFTVPRWVMIREKTLNHLIHHRAQLGVYLRLLDLPVPGSYGPSADESDD
jgi:uncharacterized damage-inducible protein DinB